MRICYLDESGGCESPDSGPSATPVMVLLGLIVNAASVPILTRDFLALKRRNFPSLFAEGPALDHILREVKGSALLRMTRMNSRDERRHANGMRRAVLDLVEAHGGRIVGRIWIKRRYRDMDAAATYCYAVQDIARHFTHYLESVQDKGLIVADGRYHKANVAVAHSIFTQKWRTGDDPYPALQEVPLFAASDNHAGLQIADLLASTLVFPMAATAYCPPRAGHVHSSARYRDVRATFGQRVRDLQYRYPDRDGRWRGGLVVSDAVAGRPGSLLFADRGQPGDELLVVSASARPAFQAG